MSRRLDDTDLNNLEAAAHGRTGVGVLAHPLDILRLVEEVRWYRSQMGSVKCATELRGDDDTVGRRAVGIEVLTVGLDQLSVPGLDETKNGVVMRNDPSIHAPLVAWEMCGGPLVDVLCRLVAGQWLMKQQYLTRLIQLEHDRTQFLNTEKHTALPSEPVDGDMVHHMVTEEVPHNDAHEQTPKYGPCPLREAYLPYSLWKWDEVVSQLILGQALPKNDDGDTPNVVKGN